MQVGHRNRKRNYNSNTGSPSEEPRNGPERLDCEMCDFRGRSRLQIEKHMKVRHSGENPICQFWRNGFCKNSEAFCGFSHPNLIPVCQNGEFCPFWPRCRYRHPEICKFQNACQNFNCTFVHFNNEEMAFLGNIRMKMNPPQNQPRPYWRPW